MKVFLRISLVLTLLASWSCTKSASSNAEEPVKPDSSTTAAATPAGTADTRSLFARLGGKDAITAVVNDFVSSAASDKRIASFFKATAADKKRLAKFKSSLVDQICEASGGPCKYSGKDMKSAHRNLGVKESHFNALVEDLAAVLDKYKVGKKEKDELLGALGSMKKDIVTK